MTWVYVYLGITVFALVVEFITTDLISIWFAGGGAVALIVSAFVPMWYVHVPIFVAVSFVLLFVLRKLLLAKLNKNVERVNADSAIGKEFVLLEDIAFNQLGSIRVNGVVWSAVATDPNTSINKSKVVKVVGLDGNKYIVEEVI